MTTKTETIIEDSFAKQIKKIQENDVITVEKKFYQHHNIEVYNILKENPHPNICEIYSVKQDDDFFTVTEAYLGDTLLTDVLPITNMHIFYKYIFQICDALEHLHYYNIVHRDLKPENIHIFDGNIILNDFDISKQVTVTTKRKDTQVLGSVGFASPEQYGFSRSDSRSDIYSLGILINMMVTGEFISDSYINGRLRYIVDRCVEISPEDRFQTIQEVRVELEKQQRGVSRWALPGYRSNNKRNKIIASIAYPFILLLIITIEAEGGISFYDHFQSKVLSGLLIISTLVVIYNYLDIRQLLPRGLRRTRFVGPIILWMVGIVAIIIIYLTLFGILDIMLAAYQ